MRTEDAYLAAIDEVRAARDRYREAIDQAMDELMVGDKATALSILQRALNQEEGNA